MNQLFGLQHRGDRFVPLIPKADDDLNVTCLTQNGQTGLERLNWLQIVFLLNWILFSFEPLSCIQLSGFTSKPVPPILFLFIYVKNTHKKQNSTSNRTNIWADYSYNSNCNPFWDYDILIKLLPQLFIRFFPIHFLYISVQ